jgi:hypothetical protein
MKKSILACILMMFLSLVSFAAVVSNSMDNSNEAVVAGSNDSSSPADASIKDTNKEESQAAPKSEIKMNVDMENKVNAEEQLDKNTEQEPEIETAIVPVPKKEKAEAPAKNKNLRAESFIVQEEWVPDGIIMGDKDNKLLISTGDTVYVTIDPDLIKPGLRCGIYRKMDHIKDGKTKEYLGYEIRRIGRLEFTDRIGNKVSSAKITVSYEPVQIEDVVKLGE